jgi:hypothetical protein
VYGDKHRQTSSDGSSSESEESSDSDDDSESNTSSSDDERTVNNSVAVGTHHLSTVAYDDHNKQTKRPSWEMKNFVPKEKPQVPLAIWPAKPVVQPAVCINGDELINCVTVYLSISLHYHQLLVCHMILMMFLTRSSTTMTFRHLVI